MSVIVVFSQEGLFQMDESILSSVKHIQTKVPKRVKTCVNELQNFLNRPQRNKIVEAPHKIVIGFTTKV
jgi:uncharacterized protein (UPF0147 family)